MFYLYVNEITERGNTVRVLYSHFESLLDAIGVAETLAPSWGLDHWFTVAELVPGGYRVVYSTKED